MLLPSLWKPERSKESLKPLYLSRIYVRSSKILCALGSPQQIHKSELSISWRPGGQRGKNQDWIQQICSPRATNRYNLSQFEYSHMGIYIYNSNGFHHIFYSENISFVGFLWESVWTVYRKNFPVIMMGYKISGSKI